MKNLLIILVSIFLLQACNPEYRLARKYVSMTAKPTVLVIPPSFLYKNNVDIHDTIGLSILDTLSRDSVIYSRSTYLQRIEDSTFMRIFINSFLNELGKNGLVVQLADSSVNQTEANWKINFVQLQLEENQQVIPGPDYESNFGVGGNAQSPTSQYDHFLNSIALNTWLKVNTDGQKADSVTLFYSDVQTDHLEQGFSLQNYLGKPVMIPNNKLQISDIYQFAKDQGQTQADLFFDLMLNSYLYFYAPNPDYYYDYIHYDHDLKKFYPANDYKFEIIK